MVSFAAHEDPDEQALAAVAQAAPESPFKTPAYVRWRQGSGESAWLFEAAQAPGVTASAYGFLRSGRVRRTLEIPSCPAEAPDGFWAGLRAWCRERNVTSLVIGSFGSPATAIPDFGHAMSRYQRREYSLDLSGPSPFSGMRKGHKHSLSKARRAGLSSNRAASADAVQAHISLIAASMERRSRNGEAVGGGITAETVSSLLASGAGELIQTRAADRVLASNLFLLASHGVYNHTQGASPEGMECGAPVFNVHEAALLYAAEGRTWFNLGGTAELDGGVERFKTGFSKSVNSIPLEAATIELYSPTARVLKSGISLLNNYVRPRTT